MYLAPLPATATRVIAIMVAVIGVHDIYQEKSVGMR
jgi:hypothetical protein